MADKILKSMGPMRNASVGATTQTLLQSATTLCNICRQKGHQQSNCPNRSTNIQPCKYDQRGPMPKDCTQIRADTRPRHLCGQLGHLKRNCPEKAPDHLPNLRSSRPSEARLSRKRPLGRLASATNAAKLVTSSHLALISSSQSQSSSCRTRTPRERSPKMWTLSREITRDCAS